MSNGAEVKGKILCSHAICSCQLGNRIIKRSMGMDGEGIKKSFSCKVNHLEHALLFKGILKQVLEISRRDEGKSCSDICMDIVESLGLWGWEEIRFFSPLEKQCINLKNTGFIFFRYYFAFASYSRVVRMEWSPWPFQVCVQEGREEQNSAHQV